MKLNRIIGKTNNGSLGSLVGEKIYIRGSKENVFCMEKAPLQAIGYLLDSS